MKIGFIFFHGWGFNNYFWSKLNQAFSMSPCFYWDFNYFNKQPQNKSFDKYLLSDVLGTTDKWVVICHSYGLVRFIREYTNNAVFQKHIIGIVSISGFLKFIKSSDNPFGIDTLILRTMIKKFNQNPAQVLQNFHEQCEFKDPYYIHHNSTISQDLSHDLNDLLSVNEEKEAEKIQKPVLILAAKNDLIVSQNIASSLKRIFSKSNLNIREDGGHGLGFNKAKWCAEQIEVFMRGIEYDE